MGEGLGGGMGGGDMGDIKTTGGAWGKGRRRCVNYIAYPSTFGTNFNFFSSHNVLMYDLLARRFSGSHLRGNAKENE